MTANQTKYETFGKHVVQNSSAVARVDRIGVQWHALIARREGA